MDLHKQVEESFAFDVQAALDEQKLVKPLPNIIVKGTAAAIFKDGFLSDLTHARWGSARVQFYMVLTSSIKKLAQDIREYKGLQDMQLDRFAPEAIALLSYRISVDPYAGPLEKYSIENSEVLKRWMEKRSEQLARLSAIIGNKQISSSYPEPSPELNSI